MNIICRQNIHTCIIYLASLLVILTVIWLAWLGNEFHLQEQTDTAFQWLKKAVTILMVIYNRKIVCNKTNKNFIIFRSEIIIFADDVYKISI